MTNDDALWKRRFLIFTLVRLSALLLLLLGLAIAVGDVVRPGGWPLAGLVLIALAIAGLLVAQRFLRRAWGIR